MTSRPDTRGAMRPAIVVILCGVIVAAMLLVVVFNVRHPVQDEANNTGFEDIEELVAPTPLTDDEIVDDPTPAAVDSDIGPMLRRGAWIQVANADGTLSQEYRCDSLSPNPRSNAPHWFAMERPEAKVYLNGGRILTLSGDFAEAYAPHRALERGTLRGDVVIRLFTSDDDTLPDTERDEPRLVLTTDDEVTFDNIDGAMRCDGFVRLKADELEMPGRGLQLLFDDRRGEFHVRLEEDVRIIITHPDTPEPTVVVDAGDSVDAVDEAADVARPRTRTGNPVETRTAPQAEPRSGRATFYLLTLHDDVVIDDRNAGSQRTITGDRLDMVFTMEGDGMGEALSWGGFIRRPGTPRHFASRGSSARSQLVSHVLATTQDSDEHTTVITCSGPLTIDPLTDPSRRLSSPDDVQALLTGDPVVVDEPDSSSTVTCGQMVVDATPGPDGAATDIVVRLVGTDPHPLHLHSPDMLAHADAMRLRPGRHDGRFIGAGWITAHDAADGRPDASNQTMRIDWADRVDLRFDGADAASLGALDRAVFHGDVVVDGDEFNLDADQVVASLADVEHLEQRTVRRIRAIGDVSASGLGSTAGSLRCQDLHLSLDTDETGRPIPTRLIADGDVRTSDDTQSLWTDRMEVTFHATESGRDVETIVASGAVYLRLNDGTIVFADRLDGHAALRTADLTGTDVMIIRDGVVIDRATHVVVSEADERIRMPGPGRLRSFDVAIAAPGTDERPRRIIVEDLPGLTERLRVAWTTRADVLPAQDAEYGDVRTAEFVGGVRVRSRDINVDDAERLIATFSADAEGLDADGTALRRIEAWSLYGLDPAAADKTPLHIIARQQPKTPGGTIIEQNVWAASVEVMFAEGAPTEVTPDGIAAEVERFVARDDVRVRLDDGTTVHADALVGTPRDRAVDLTGSPVRVVADTTLLVADGDLRLIDRGADVDLIGAGRLTTYRTTIPTNTLGVPLDDLSMLDVEMVARWSESALYHLPQDGDPISGIDLQDDVHVEARPTPLELVRIDARSLALEFVEDTSATASTSSFTSAGGRTLSLLTARGDARLESATWRTAADVGQAETARLFYVAGQHVTFNDATGYAQVVGNGELLIHDTWPDDSADSEPESPETAFASRGTTVFRWSRNLEMTPDVDDIFNIVMTGDVQMIHRNLENEAATMTGDRLEARVHRPRTPGSGDGLDLGGHARLDRLFGSGRVFIRTTTRDIQCDEFDYRMRRYAEVRALPGRRVIVKTAGTAAATTADRFRWDMVNDSITVMGTGG